MPRYVRCPECGLELRRSYTNPGRCPRCMTDQHREVRMDPLLLRLVREYRATAADRRRPA